MLKDMRVGLAQFVSRLGDTELNLTNMTAFAENAAKDGVDILCFPECALQGYSPQKAKEISEPLNSCAVQRLSECARDLRMTLLVGMVERADSTDKPFITQLVIHPDRAVQSYRKVHLGRSERNFFSAGDNFPIFETGGTRFAIGICWDWHFPEMATIYSLKGAQILFAPHASPVVSGDRKEIWLKYLGARAYDNSVYLAACNLVGPNGQGKEFSGGALMLGPKGEVLVESFAEQEDILIANLSAEKINRLRTPRRASMKDSFFLVDRRKELYRELLELNCQG